ncbi:flagellar motor switch phosphatase FliY [Liquorilactobacillus mali]|uniref:Flagellar motor switch protein n=1 Tax=Liquorilactobacillus mali KCTC 3596 = DSM 20444 TaxID=1046596 RepID=J1F683_9LACO|nr:flagellar motor switch phosphatase FliY [Liquorilactobacillus mali]AJA34083.1 flagellar motor switch protein FliY [Liquorilactobacillus mali KCTC 3596 = DSM 20444]EJF02226.1 flagellar motor switch protein FliY [Liquorilactobacillus mali KCTC 3596 = DSM 20444]KRN11107.1 flagellar motor switch protein [Liquorilactobacillus mali KCTC 3596 = DSM 20444]MDC7953945.1 flagellar motor switch phosphatase FliY [Liquorilactobacillus mali]QFQ75601.1 flagellar motor switch phosphatase FliY [Liquorilactob
MSDSLSQEEIDAMMAGAVTNDTAEAKDDIDEKTKQDIIGEVGNISMSQAATTLSSILNKRVSITTPRVEATKFGDILGAIDTPKVSTVVGFKEGLVGSNLLLLEVKDAIVIADLMMGGDGKPENKQFTDLELSAVAEAMNQMIGSASTSMATMINRKVDILPPNVKLWENPEAVHYDNLDKDADVYRISFSLSVEGLIESEIMQIFTADMVEDIAKAMLSDKATTVRDDEKVESKTTVETSTAEPTTEAPQQEEQEKSTVEKPVEVSKPEFQALNDERKAEGDNLDLLLDVPLNLSVVLGRSEKKVRDILSFGTGSVIELDRLTDEPLEILLNGKPIATGEVVVINENFGIRITNILSPTQRIKRLK